MNKDALIVGIDPGTETGIALINLDGNFILTESMRNFSHSKLSRFILEFGEPLIVASDTYPVSRKVEKIAATFSAILIHPHESLRRKEKIRLVKLYSNSKNGSSNGLKLNISTKHEKDALAAALFAWNKIKQSIKRIDKKVERYGLDGIYEDLNYYVKKNVLIKGANVKSCIRLFLEKKTHG